MSDAVVMVGSFLLAFKAILVEGSEIVILSLATVEQLGRNNVLLGVVAGAFASILLFIGVWQAFVCLQDEALISVVTGAVILYYAYRFLLGFKKYSTLGRGHSGPRWRSWRVRSSRETSTAMEAKGPLWSRSPL